MHSIEKHEHEIKIIQEQDQEMLPRFPVDRRDTDWRIRMEAELQSFTNSTTASDEQIAASLRPIIGPGSIGYVPPASTGSGNSLLDPNFDASKIKKIPFKPVNLCAPQPVPPPSGQRQAQAPQLWIVST